MRLPPLRARVAALSNSAQRAVAVIGAVLAVVALVAGAAGYAALVATPGDGPRADTGIVEIELDGGAGPRLYAHGGLYQAVEYDFVLIAGYGVALLIGTTLARWLVRRSIRGAAAFGLFTAVVAVLADVVENALLLGGAHTTTVAGVDLYDAAAVAATIKFAALVPASLAAATGVGLALARGLGPRGAATKLEPGQWRRATPVAPPLHATQPLAPAATEPGNSTRAPQHEPSRDAVSRWLRAYRVPHCAHAPNPARAEGGDVIGIGLSGGGIRAASTALGVFQSRRFRHEVVPHAKYLVSVSGGGYTSGAFAQLLTAAGATTNQVPAEQAAEHAERGRTAFLVGTPEEDHIRRHSSYLADTPGLMISALATILVHLLFTLVLLFGTAMLVGVLCGLVLRSVPLAVLDPSVWRSVESGIAPDFPALRESSYWAAGIVAGVAILAWLSSQYVAAHRPHPDTTQRSRWTAVRRALTALAAIIALVALALPTLIWFAAWFLHHSRGGGLHTLTPLLSVAFTYFASMGALLAKARTQLAAATKPPSALPTGLVQIVLVIGGNLVIAVSWLILLGGAATIALHPMDTTTKIAIGVLAVVVVFLGGFTDETTLSLHPFYRARLAATFAVRRVRGSDGRAFAVPYDSRERSQLWRYGTHPQQTAFPHIVFAASATVGDHRAPPGQNRVSYTFCSDWVGGPDVGWVDTEALAGVAPARLRRDLTVQGAVALSGAAIAASTGGQGAGWYESLFVLTGARLGAWMPNPAFVINRYQDSRTVSDPPLPRIRRLSYLLRELVGVHSPDDPLLQVTDGGFYDNLGLIELFRRRCTTIVCVDASGDTPPFAATLAQTLLTAHRELGVETTLDDDTWSTYTAGGADPLQPEKPLENLSARLSRSGLITGTFTYPACANATQSEGRLIVAKAALWRELGYPLLTYSARTASFPFDSTADQFFDADQYLAYTELGHRLGDAIVDALHPGAQTVANADHITIEKERT